MGQAEHDTAVASMSGKAADPLQSEALFIKPDDFFELSGRPGNPDLRRLKLRKFNCHHHSSLNAII